MKRRTGTLVKCGRGFLCRVVVDGKVKTAMMKNAENEVIAKKRDAEVAAADWIAREGWALKQVQDIRETQLARLGGITDQLQRIEDGKPSTTLKHGWQAYLDQANRPDSGTGTLANYESQYEAFVKWIEIHHPETIELRHVSKEQANDYAGHLAKTISPSTYNRHLNALSLVWRILGEKARITVNPWSTITRKKSVPHSRRELTIEELGRIVEASTGEMRLLLALGIYTGLRLGDAACLRWDNIDMVKRIISLIPMKTERKQKRVVLPIHETLYSLLQETPKAKRKGFVLPHSEARFNSFKGALSKDVLTLFQSVGIKTTSDEKNLKEWQRNSAECGYHSLRHTFVSLCASSGVPQSVVQSLVGHGSPAMTQHYTHIGTATTQNAIASLPSITGASCPQDATAMKFQGILNELETLSLEQLKKLHGHIQILIQEAKEE